MPNNLSIVEISMATWAIILADDRDFGGSNLTAEIFVSFRVSLGIIRVGYGQVNHCEGRLGLV